jgi:hypothetical protein
MANALGSAGENHNPIRAYFQGEKRVERRE